MRIVFIGITLFALFFGAGNLIFPVTIGQFSAHYLQWLSVCAKYIDNLFLAYLPLYTEGLGWLIPAIVGAILGYIYALFTKKNNHPPVEFNNYV